MSRLRCHELDRRDELEMILFNRKLPYAVAERGKLEKVVLEAQDKLQAYDLSVKRQDRWIRLLKDSLVHHWIDNPDQYIKEWEAKNE
ncbi:hypothetical protein D3C75_695630 [compost metagenome]